eukprot:8748070-Alexandrium_andersonii.AAC.1
MLSEGSVSRPRGAKPALWAEWHRSAWGTPHSGPNSRELPAVREASHSRWMQHELSPSAPNRYQTA